MSEVRAEHSDQINRPRKPIEVGGCLLVALQKCLPTIYISVNRGQVNMFVCMHCRDRESGPPLDQTPSQNCKHDVKADNDYILLIIKRFILLGAIKLYF